jgi:hypothetical protein
MAAVGVTISGVLYDVHARTTQNVVLIGDASLTGLSVGGGPMPGGPGQGGGDKPPGIWGPPSGLPTPPIANAPGVGPNPDPPGKPPEPVEPPVHWKAVWAGPQQGWVVVGVIDPDVSHPVPST